MADVLVLGDQLSTSTGALADADPSTDGVVMVESAAKLRQRPWHRAKLVLVLSAMRHFADGLRERGFTVDYVRADSLRAGLSDAGADPEATVVMSPSSWDLRQTLERWSVQLRPNDAYIVGEDAFRASAGEKPSLLMERFYRRVRAEHGWLMDGEEPIGGTWNLDAENREPPPKDVDVDVPTAYRPREDELDAEVRADVRAYEADLGLELYGEDRPREFPATRAEARRSLRAFVERRLEGFGPLEDAVVAEEPVLWHSQLSVPLNLGLLYPAEVCEAVDAAYRERLAAGERPHLPSYEGYLRQVCGWQEYVWGLYMRARARRFRAAV